jgi:hypothetical protein
MFNNPLIKTIKVPANFNGTVIVKYDITYEKFRRINLLANGHTYPKISTANTCSKYPTSHFDKN